MSHYTAVHVDDIEPAGPGGAVRFVRRELGARAFGINQFIVPPNVAGPEHDEIEADQEEVYVIVGGSGAMVIGGERVELRPGLFIRVAADVRRNVEAGPDGLVFVAIGAPIGTPYEPRGHF